MPEHQPPPPSENDGDEPSATLPSSTSTLVSPYFSNAIKPFGEDGAQLSNHSAILARERLFSPSRSGPTQTDGDNESIEVGMELLQEEASSDFGEDGMVIDDAMLQQIDLAEMEAMQPRAVSKLPVPSFGSGSGSGSSRSVTCQNSFTSSSP